MDTQIHHKKGSAKQGSSSQHQPIIYLIRHGEKPPKNADGSDQDGLSVQGIDRAQALVQVFGANSTYDIQYILAEKPKKDGGRARPSETVTPLAASLGLKMNSSIDRDDAESVAAAAKSFEGPGNVLICWEHGQLASIAEAIGITQYGDSSGWSGPVTYPGNRFDLIWVVPPPWTQVTEVRSEKVQGLDDKVVVSGDNNNVTQSAE